MKYAEFADIFNSIIFENSKSDLIGKIAQHPERYVGLFRPTKPTAKIIQNLLQSHEIRYGGAFEVLIKNYLREFGYEILNNRLADGNLILNIDQLFRRGNDVYFAEQKIRDDYDSSKKRGQIDNFEKKIHAINTNYPSSVVTGFFYFIDDSFTKNKNYYAAQLAELADAYGVTLHNVYGREFFARINQDAAWDEIINHLTCWRTSIPDLPEINFDAQADKSFAEMKSLSPNVFRKLFANADLDEVLRALFPTKATLRLLAQNFQAEHRQHGKQIHQTLYQLCTETIARLQSR